MRKLFIISLLALLLGVGVVALIEKEPGYVLITYGHWTVESSLWVGLVVIGLFVLVLYGLLRLLHLVLGGRQSLSTWLGERKAGKASRLTSRGLVNFIEGNWSKARNQLLRGADNNEAPLLNYLVAARASCQLGDPGKMHELLAAAEKSDAEAGTAVALTRAELKLAAKQYESAVATLERARRDAGRHPQVLDLLRQGYLGLQDWKNLAALLPELKKYQVLPEDKCRTLEHTVYTRLLKSCAGNAAADSLRQQWQQVPGELKRDPAMVCVYARLLIAEEAHDTAEKAILRGQKQQWNPGLARLYGYVVSADPARQLANAEDWIAQHKGDAQLYLCLGRLAARNELWGKARDYFESSYQLDRTPEVCAELGRLLAAQGEERPAAAYFREGVAMQTDLPALPMPAELVPDSHLLQHS